MMVAKNRGVAIITAGVIFKGLVVKRVATKEAVLKMIRDIKISDNRVIGAEL